MPAIAWSIELEQRLRELIPQGLSGSQIAARLNDEFSLSITRCAVIGKTRRIKLQLRGSSGNRIRVAADRKVRIPKPKPEPKVTPKPVAPVAPDTDPVKLFDLNESNACRWPIGEAVPYLYCGAPRAFCDDPLHCYCDYHERLAHERKADRKFAPIPLYTLVRGIPLGRTRV